MLSIIITAFKEPKTITRAIEAFLNQKIKDGFEILVVCPDEETQQAVLKYARKNSRIRFIKDKGQGKPKALNLAFNQAQGDILVLSDGDVYVGENSVSTLIKPFDDPKIGAVSGRPISLNSRDILFGFWSHLLTNAGAHLERLNRARQRKFIACSGYLYAIRKGIVQKIPEKVLSDDVIISHIIWQKGYKIVYSPEAKVYVKYPSNFRDWLIQKRRSAGGYMQINKYFKNPPRMRSFSREIISGTFKALSYPKTLKEFWWTLLLFFARLYLWIIILWDQRIRKPCFEEMWKRVESTK